MIQKQAEVLIALISIAWGSSYLLMKLGLNGLGVFNLICLRFGIAFIVTALIFPKHIVKIELKTIGYSSILGGILFGVFACLMFGLKTTTTSSAAFLTSTAVVFVLILQVIVTQKWPKFPIIIGVILTISGIALLTIKDSFILEEGSALCIAGAFLYACHIIATDHCTHKTDSLGLGIFQLGFTALYGYVFCLIWEYPALPQNDVEWFAVLGLALICSAFGFVVQPLAQRYTTPERTGLLFSLEPISAALFGYVFLHESLQLAGYIGSVLILGGILVSGKNNGNKLIPKTTQG
jgi:drug/metabolite transporter (DMT)-like permease